MDSPTKTMRKVRFTLPITDDPNVRTIDFDLLKIGSNTPTPSVVTPPQFPTVQEPAKVDEQKVHGTTRYINGVLKFCPDDYYKPTEPVEPPEVPRPPKKENYLKSIVRLKPCLKEVTTKVSARTVAPSSSRKFPKLNFSKKINNFIGTTNVNGPKGPKQKAAAPPPTNCGEIKKIKLKPKPSKFRSHTVIFLPSKHLKGIHQPPVVQAYSSVDLTLPTPPPPPPPLPPRKKDVIDAEPSSIKPPPRKKKIQNSVKLPDLLCVPTMMTCESLDPLCTSISHLSLNNNNNNNNNVDALILFDSVKSLNFKLCSILILSVVVFVCAFMY